MLKNIKKRIIHFLGGITKEELIQLRLNFSVFAQENLQSKSGHTSPDSLMYFPYDGDRLMILRSNMHVCGGRVKELIFAPWCNNVSAREVIITGDQDA